MATGEMQWNVGDLPASMAPGASAFLTQRPATREEIEQANAQLTGAVVVLAISSRLDKPWGLNELVSARPAALFHSDTMGACQAVVRFLAESRARHRHSDPPLEVKPYPVTNADRRDAAPNQAAIARNGVMLADALSLAQDRRLPIVGLILWNGESPGTANLRSRMTRAKVPLLHLQQLPPNTDDWLADQRQELEERADRILAELAPTLAHYDGDAGVAYRRRALALGEAAVRREYAWRRPR